MTTAFKEFRYSSREGLTLFARDYGPRTSPWLPVVCLPGLTRTSRDFDRLAAQLAADPDRPRRVAAFDYRGRGRSDWDKTTANYNVAVETGDVADGMAALGIPRATIVGTSRGGIIGMLMAFTRPQTVAALVLNDIGPYIEPRGLVRLKSYVGRSPRPQDWSDAARIQRRLHGAQFTGLDDDGWDRFARLSYRDVDGRPESDYDPRLADTMAGVEVDQPSPGIWNEFAALQAVPILAIHGANSDILSAPTVERMARDHRQVEVITVADQGHPPQLDEAGLIARIASFVKTVEDGAVPNPVGAEPAGAD